MAFRIEDLMLTITVQDKGEARVRLEGCDDATMRMILASCGKTQIRPCDAAQDNPAAVAFRPTMENLQILREELEDALAALSAVERALGPAEPMRQEKI